ncbi:MAG: DUF5320 domain-containing protein [Desulfovibrionaceae bacterium]
MPGFDGTGPNGQGAMSGRGMGYCAGDPQRPAAGGRALGRGRGRGRGLGRGGRGRGLGQVGAAPGGDAARIEQLETELARLKQERSAQD